MAFTRKDIESVCDVWEAHPEPDAHRKLALSIARQLLETLGGEPAHAGKERDRARARGDRVSGGADRTHRVLTPGVGDAVVQASEEEITAEFTKVIAVGDSDLMFDRLEKAVAEVTQ